MSRTRFLAMAVFVGLGIAVAAFAAINLVVGQGYTLTGTMSKCNEHPNTFFLDLAAAGGGSGGGSHSARAGSDHSGHGQRLLLKPASAQVNLGATFQALKPGQKVTATGVYLGLVGSTTARESHMTLRTDRISANPMPSPREVNFDNLYELRRQ